MNKRLSMDKGAWQARFGPTRARRDYKAWRTIPIDSTKSMKFKAFPKAPCTADALESMDRAAIFALSTASSPFLEAGNSCPPI
ncbi:hypothetical protein [Microvirga lotononidis]|uniref:Uncharacterized protein n=1 Tax=Microvirga lotononidis TaxID=864069 RepID=I4YX23_9HYPH|nr:hypothetical protein [Microvirga lotononidis]EIM28515.1 hypothetical protein MicloDRAFT_00051010 [Microvirga lotononidis]WQO27414.1 hypothetical protein U0023_22695 [Microvirga lotononidis]